VLKVVGGSVPSQNQQANAFGPEKIMPAIENQFQDIDQYLSSNQTKEAPFGCSTDCYNERVKIDTG
jgi:hypothetical protein